MARKKSEKQTDRQKNQAVRKPRNYRRRQRRTSIYFLLWAVFSALALLIVALISAVQQVVMAQTYKGEAAREVYEAGKAVHAAVDAPLPDNFNGSWSAFLNFLSGRYGVQAYLLSEEGELIFPRNPEIGEDSERLPQEYSVIVESIITELNDRETAYAVFEGNGEFIYGAEVSVYGDVPLYLYVAQPLDLLDAALAQMRLRTGLIAVFVFVLSFAVSSAVAGWLVKPISEMTKKARQLAKGDFAVDFHGRDYGEELVGLADSLNFARDELSKTDAMQKELLANVSHDFKTPLTMIKAYAAMIQEISGDIPEKRNKHAQVIVDEADRLASLVSDLLDLSKLRAGIAELKKERVDMSAYAREILDRFAYLQETQGYCFQAEIEEELYALVDEVKIGQVLYNLIGNAVNYTGEDKLVCVSLKRTGGETFRFSVRDTGAGIQEEELATIWDRYYRSSEMHKRPVKGTGLGLSIVKVVLEKHGLHFGVESELGKGSTFFVDFPVCK